ncbi:hypothetical protein [Acinetobacter proteolyticus]|uniref:hypothetical protein n=1 Tax=Acinetobacter proteolyticus TaxID=1776741 RepID=UPI001428959D|nr:hypothetical protein [Acinetobacter proteolyticus]
MRRNNNEWLFILIFIVLAIVAVAINTWNTVQVCKDQDVYWVNGTQHICKLFK